MSRTGIEEKLPWRSLPAEIRSEIERALGSRVKRAERVWGGYSPSLTYRSLLDDGRHAFIKGVSAQSSEFQRSAQATEERVYSELGHHLDGWSPRLYAIAHYRDWHILILEDVGPQSVPPWTPVKAKSIMHALSAFHGASAGGEFPDWLVRPEQSLTRLSWARVREESQDFQKIAALMGDESRQARAWFQEISFRVGRALQSDCLGEGPFSLLHGDLRSDNLRFSQGRLTLFDWPAIAVGRPEWDVVAFAQSISIEGGLLPEQIMAWYGERFALTEDRVGQAIAWWLTFFSGHAWRPEIPGLPRLRRFQRQQLGAMLAWISRMWSLPYPDWLARLME